MIVSSQNYAKIKQNSDVRLYTKYDCNGWYKNSRHKGEDPKFYVDKSIADQTLNFWNISLERFLEELSLIGFTFSVTVYNRKLKWKNNNEMTPHYEFKLLVPKKYKESSYYRYLGFCLFRHLYYYQNYFKIYFDYIDNNTTEHTKILVLGLLRGIPTHTYLQATPTKVTTFAELLEKLLKNGSNYSVDGSDASLRFNFLAMNSALVNKKILNDVLSIIHLSRNELLKLNNDLFKVSTPIYGNINQLNYKKIQNALRF
jgi:hypothetical protein